jgi:hypothetical protein
MSQSPVHLCVGTNLETGKMDITAYFGESIGLKTEESNVRFQPLELHFADETEYTGCKTQKFILFFFAQY